MFSLLSSTLNTGLKSDPVGIVNTKCKTAVSTGKKEWDQRAIVFLIYIFSLNWKKNF